MTKKIGDLEKLVSLPIADSLGVNVNESERERSGIICGPFCGVRRVGPIFRGAQLFATTISWRPLGSNQCELMREERFGVTFRRTAFQPLNRANPRNVPTGGTVPPIPKGIPDRIAKRSPYTDRYIIGPSANTFGIL